MSRIPVNQPYSTAQSIPFGGPDPAAKFGKHAGIDYAVPIGREVYAPCSGSVTAYKWGQYHGNVVEIFNGKEYVHMLHNSVLKVSPGQPVSEGQLVSLSGSTGEGVTGPHVHFGVATKSLPNVTSFSNFINPNDWLKGDDNMEEYYPNHGDLVNIHNMTGWPGHPITPAEDARWCYGTGNPYWGNVHDVWVALTIEVSQYSAANAPKGKFKPYVGPPLFVEDK